MAYKNQPIKTIWGKIFVLCSTKTISQLSSVAQDNVGKSFHFCFFLTVASVRYKMHMLHFCGTCLNRLAAANYSSVSPVQRLPGVCIADSGAAIHFNSHCTKAFISSSFSSSQSCLPIVAPRFTPRNVFQLDFSRFLWDLCMACNCKLYRFK